MEWHRIDTQDDLNRLDAQVCWDDSETIEYYANPKNERYFPDDVARSGYSDKHLHVLCRVCSAPANFLEIVFVACDYYSPSFLDSIALSGKVDKLKRIEITDRRGSLRLRCGRMIYRFVGIGEGLGWNYFLRPGVIGFPKGELDRSGVVHVEGRDQANRKCHLILQEKSGIPALCFILDADQEAVILVEEKSELKKLISGLSELL